MTRKKNKSTNKIRHGEFPNFPGQHFMHNKKLIHDIVDQANISLHDTVLDLGAGKGALTSVLCQRAGKVLAVEYDRMLVEMLKQKFMENPNAKVIRQDILKLRLPMEPFIVVSNIPYAITTKIMKMLLNKPSSGFQRGVIVMEEGAAKRFTSSFVKDPYVIAWRMWFDIRYVKGISRRQFSPPPRTDSAMIAIHRKGNPIVPMKEYLIFWGLVEYVLRDPGLHVDAALKGIFTPPQVKLLKRNHGIKDHLTVAHLSEQQWGVIFETMIKYVPSFRWPRIKREKLDYC